MIQTEIENNLTDGMDLLHLEVENESPNHNVEPGSESHFKVEEVEIKTGRRMEGTLLAARSFAAKCMSGAGAFAAGLILTYSAWPKNAAPGQVDETILFNFGFTAITASIILWSISLFTISLVTTTKESHQEKLSELNYIED